jgi:hypothetical protein
MSDEESKNPNPLVAGHPKAGNLTKLGAIRDIEIDFFPLEPHVFETKTEKHDGIFCLLCATLCVAFHKMSDISFLFFIVLLKFL